MIKILRHVEQKQQRLKMFVVEQQDVFEGETLWNTERKKKKMNNKTG